MLTQNELRKQLIYEPETGTFFKKRKDGSKGRKTGTERASNDRRILKLNGERFFSHRIAYIYCHGWLPDLLDHINGDPSDNRIKNLRPASVSQNAMNRSHRRDSTQRFKGVYFDRRRKKYYARIAKNGRTKVMGGFLSDVQAAYRYDMASIELHGHFGKRNFLPLVTVEP